MSFKICAIGCGSHSTNAHGPSMRKYAQQYPDTLLAACCDLSEARAATFAQAFGFARTYTDIDKMFRAEKPDACLLVSPIELTAALSRKVMELGVPIMLEKPPGLNREETLSMMETAEKTGTPNMVAFNRRHIPLLNRLQGLMDQAGREKLQFVQYDFYRFRRRDSDFSSTAIHGIDAVKAIVGADYKRVSFEYQSLPQIGETVANYYLHAAFKNGAHAQMNFTPMTGCVLERADVNMLDNSFLLEPPIWGGADMPGRLVHYTGRNGEPVVYPATAEPDGDQMFESNGFYREHVVFYEAIRSAKPLRDDIASCLQSVEIAAAMGRREAVIEW